MKKMLLKTVIVFFFSFMVFTAFASGVSIDKASIYERGLKFFSFGRYREAMEAFQQLDGYKDSASWKKYAEGFVEINEADDTEEAGYLTEAETHIRAAQNIFQRLSKQTFEDSSNMEKYCKAREFQINGLLQNALDLYSQISTTMDSWERYDDIINGKAIPTQAPVFLIPDRYFNISAHAVKKLNTYMGPGSKYLQQDLISIKSGLKFSICAKEEDYYMIEVEVGEDRIRCWGPQLYIHCDEKTDIPEIERSRKGFMIETVEGIYGPGKEYLKTGIMVAQGTQVIAYSDEGRYTMVELTHPASGQPVRTWIPTDSFR